jgi:DNA primase
MYLTIDNYVIDTPLKEILENVRLGLTNGKLKVIQDSGSNLLVTCPTHKDGLENEPSCYVYVGEDTPTLKYGSYHCFTCGDSGSFEKFLATAMDTTVNKAKFWLIKNYGKLANNDVDRQLDASSKLIQSLLDNLTHKEENNYLDESCLDNLESYHPYMARRKITREIAEKFKVKYNPSSQYIIFPVWDENDNLVMLTKRSTIQKKFLIEKDKEKPVYLLNYIIKNNITKICVCESQINALTLWGLGIPAVALFGTGTKHQYDVLNHSGVRQYYLCFDGDDAGFKGSERFHKNVQGYIKDVKVPLGKDINDLDEDTIWDLIMEAQGKC